MFSGVVPHYRPCLLAWYLTIGHTCCSAYTSTYILSSWCRRKRDGFKSGAILTEVQLHQTCMLIRCHSLICLLVQCNSIRHVCWVHYSDTCVCKVLLHQARNLVCYKNHQTCLQVRCGSHGFVKLISYHPGRHLECMHIKF